MVRLVGSGAKPAQRRNFFEENGMAENDNILTKLQDLLLYLIPQLNKFPRDQKFVLGDRIEMKLLAVQEFCLRAYLWRAGGEDGRSGSDDWRLAETRHDD